MILLSYWVSQQLVSALKITTVSYLCSIQKIAHIYQNVNFQNFFSTSVVTIGFNGIYSVNEDTGSIRIVVLVLMNCLARDVVVTLSTLDNTARSRFAQCLTCYDQYSLCTYILMYAAGMDYTSVSRNLTFNADFTTHVVEVPITDDHTVEHSEIINLTLRSTDSAVILNPSTSTITIEDVDSKLQNVDSSIYAAQV